MSETTGESKGSQEFASSFVGFMEQMRAQAPKTEPPLRRIIREHLGSDPAGVVVVSHSFAGHEHASVQRALDSWLGREGRSAQLQGVVSTDAHMQPSLSQLCCGQEHYVTPGPARYVDVDIGEGRFVSCLHSGLVLVRDGEKRQVLMLNGPSEYSYRSEVRVEAASSVHPESQALIDALRSEVRLQSVHRGRIVSLSHDRRGNTTVSYHRLPRVDRAQIILSPGTLERVERHTIGFAKHAEVLRAGGRHMRRGLLLYGPPGTGKTFTAMHVASRMEGRTVLLVTGRGQGLIEKTCELARMLQPATVIVEDVDLIAASRDFASSACAQPLLMELLNQMDGLGEDADVLFVLTTNKAEVLEEALASRPGRVDQAIEIPLPDSDCRRRLLQLYSQGLSGRPSEWETIVRRTEGTSAAFIKELMRRGALFAAERVGETAVTEKDLDDALHDLALGGRSTKGLVLGFGHAEGTGTEG